mgnify:CR=1 FL=1
MEKKISISQIKEVAQEAYNEVKGSTGGKNADYILPCQHRHQTVRTQHLPDERADHQYRRYRLSFRYRVRLEGTHSHPYPAPIRRTESAGHDSADATGLPFNSIIAILLENDHPSTPLVNAGAISACSMVQPVGNSDKKWDAIVQNITELCGSAPQLIDELYKSETATNSTTAPLPGC